MNTRRMTGSLLVALALAVPVGAQTADLKMQFVYDGDVSAPAKLDINKDVEFCGQHGLTNEKLIVNPENRGVKNVVVYVFTGRGGTDLDDVAPRNQELTLANENCRFEPRYVIAQTGDTLKVTNPDPVGHNANLNFFRNRAQNFTIPAGQEKSVLLEEPEPAPIPVDCNIHPWMRAYVVVLEHPFAAVSDADGVLEIKGLPAGKKVTFRVYHEAVAQGKSLDEVMIDGKKESWRRSRFDLTLGAGENDLGKVVIPAGTLSAN